MLRKCFFLFPFINKGLSIYFKPLSKETSEISCKIPAAWYLGVCVNSCPSAWAGLNGLLITNGVWQKWRAVASRFSYTGYMCLWLSSFKCFHVLRLPHSGDTSCLELLLGYVHREGNWVLCPIACEVPNPVNSLLSKLGSWSFPRG